MTTELKRNREGEKKREGVEERKKWGKVGKSGEYTGSLEIGV